MTSEICTTHLIHEILAFLCSCFESTRVSWILGLANSVTWFQYLIILVRSEGTIEVLLVSLCTAQFDVLELTQRICIKKERYSFSRKILHCFSNRKSAGKKCFGKKEALHTSQLHVPISKTIYQIVLLIYTDCLKGVC